MAVPLAAAPMAALLAALIATPTWAAAAAPLSPAPPTTMAAPPASTARGLTGERVIESSRPLRAKVEQNLLSPIVLRMSELTSPGTPETNADAAPPRVRRYRIEFIGAIVGEFDLRDWIEDIDGRPVADLDPIVVRIVSELPAEYGTDLFASGRDPLTFRSHYRLAMGLLGGLWIAVPLVYFGRRMLRLRQVPPPPVAVPPATLAEQLRPLVDAAQRGRLSIAEQGRLELLLLGFWRERLGMTGLGHSDSIAQLRTHPEAGRLLLAVERWLHARRPEGKAADGDERSVQELLSPYAGSVAIAEGALP